MTTQPRTGFVRVTDVVDAFGELVNRRKPDRPRNRGRQCASGKIRHPSEAGALTALMRARKQRAVAGDTRPPEIRVYWCDGCLGWHLTSQEPHPAELDPVREQMNGEPIEVYVKRLERRIVEQRAQIVSLLALGHGMTNRSTRARVALLTTALGRMTERWEIERRNREELVRQVEALRSRRGLLSRLRSRRKPEAVTSEAVSPLKEKRQSVA